MLDDNIKSKIAIINQRRWQKDKDISTDEKRELLNFVFLNLKLRDEKVDLTFQNGFEIVVERVKDGNWLSRSV